MGVFGPDETKQYYASGKVKMKYYADKNGYPEGDYSEYYENGKLQAQGKVHNGRKEGKWSFFNNDGTLQAIGEFSCGYKTGQWSYNVSGLPKSMAWSIYKEPAKEFGLNYPSLWKLENKKDKVLLAVFENVEEGKYGHNFNMFEIKLPKPVEITNFIKEAVNNQILNAPKPMQLVSGVSAKLDINGLDSYFCVMKTTNFLNQPMRYIQFYICRELSVYVINLFCEEARLPQADKIFKEIVFSFRAPY